MSSSLRLEERLDFTLALARQAGETIVAARREASFGRSLKRGVELVTDTDVAVDRQIAAALDQRFPNEGRLTEELTPDSHQVDLEAALWIVDPIDGTVNFAHGHHHVAVSIAWALDGEIQLGVVHAPFLDETFSAIRGRGAWLNDAPIAASSADAFDEALIATGFSYTRADRAKQVARLARILDAGRDVRRNGSAALDLCGVACGRLDAYYESVSPWDFAAGRLIAAEAGALVGHLGPVPAGIPAELHGEDLICCAPKLEAQLRALLAQADRDFAAA